MLVTQNRRNVMPRVQAFNLSDFLRDLRDLIRRLFDRTQRMDERLYKVNTAASYKFLDDMALA